MASNAVPKGAPVGGEIGHLTIFVDTPSAISPCKTRTTSSVASVEIGQVANFRPGSRPARIVPIHLGNWQNG